MNVKRYTPIPYIVYSNEYSHICSVDMHENISGKYVDIEDYKYLMGVVKNLRTKLEKKDRRSRKFKKEGFQ